MIDQVYLGTSETGSATSELYKMEFVVLLKKTTSVYRMVNGNSEVIAADLQNPYRMEPPASLRCGQISTTFPL